MANSLLVLQKPWKWNSHCSSKTRMDMQRSFPPDWCIHLIIHWGWGLTKMLQKYHLCPFHLSPHECVSSRRARSIHLLNLLGWKAEGDAVVTVFLLSQQGSTHNSRGGRRCHLWPKISCQKPLGQTREGDATLFTTNRKASKRNLFTNTSLISSQPPFRC